ncbi:MAG: SMC-Scp complex subunit ScpB [Erysipelotrichaceae bacterium]|nr:SMC-Scp complex subunit ScpB [Erysipelotrichaceae bacterium]MDY5251370.1 SMC-Scp complex subunit ScpB [Erysipelotrichaceae bacterium]
MEVKQIMTILEGLLFICGDEGLDLTSASTLLEIDQASCEQAFDQLQAYYLQDDRGMEIERFNDTYKFISKAMIHPYAQKLFANNKANTLSQSALETLAIIAYKQPITRVEIEELRGVGADMMLRKLLARNLIKEVGRSEAAGRPILYEVTDEFLDNFKLLSLDELPELPSYGKDDENEELFD